MSGRHVATTTPAPGPGAVRPLATTTLLRRPLGAERSTLVLVAVLTLVASVFLLAVPRVSGRAADGALGDAFRTTTPVERDLGLRLTPRAVDVAALPSTTLGPPAGTPFAAVDAAVRRGLGAHVDGLLAEATVAAQSDLLRVRPASGRALRVAAAEVVIRLEDGLDRQVRWVSGSAPGPATTTRDVRTVGGDLHRVQVTPVALLDSTARAWGVSAGDVLDLQISPFGRIGVTPTAVVLAGTFEPVDPTAEAWAAEPRMLGVARALDPEGGTVEQAAVIAPLSSYTAVADGLWRARPGKLQAASPALTHTWRYRLAADRLVRTDASALRGALARLTTDDRTWEGVEERPTLVTGIPRLLDRYDRDVAVTATTTAVVTSGVTALTALVLALTAVVAAGRRSAEVRLLRARGASRRRVVAQVALPTGLLALPVALLAGGLVLAALPGEGTLAPVLEVAVVVLLPVLAAAVVTGLRLRALDEPPDDTRRTVRAARRVVGEVLVVALAVLAVGTVRSRGDTIAAGSTDWFASLTPVLVGLAAALVVLRLLPVPVGLVARLAARGRGYVAHLGATRAARSGTGGVLPLTAVVVGTTLVCLTAALGSAVAQQRTEAAYRLVGADARVDGERIDPAVAEAVARRPGVRAVALAHVDATATLGRDRASAAVTVLGVDPASFATVLRGTPLAIAAPDLPDAGSGRVPVVVSGGLGATGGADLDLVVRGTTVPVHRVATAPLLTRTGAGRDGPVVLVRLDALTRVLPSTRPTTLLVAADAAAQDRLSADARRDPTSVGALVTGVVTTRDRVDAVASRALSRLVEGAFLAGAVLGALLTALAVWLLLAATRPDRTQLVIRLRTLGLPPGGERRLAWAEVMPLLAAGVAAGAACGVLAPRALAGVLDLAPYTGAVVRVPLAPAVVPAVLAAAGVLVLGGLALLTDAASARRGDLAEHLRRGDTA